MNEMKASSIHPIGYLLTFYHILHSYFHAVVLWWLAVEGCEWLKSHRSAMDGLAQRITKFVRLLQFMIS